VRRPAALRRPARLARAAAAAALAAALAAAAGCASATRALVRPYVLAPSGLEVPEQRLRDALAAGRWEAALAQAGRAKDGGPPDALLRELYRGTAAYYGARWDESATAFHRAAAMADDRFTKRVSRGALALATSDRALPYVPGDNERLFAHYYAALGYLHAGDPNGAAVEARRLAYRLQQAEERLDPLDRSARAALRYFTGAVFEAAGDREDAEVAYRNAAALGAAVDTAVARRAAADSAMRGVPGRADRRRARRAEPAAAAPAGPAAGDVVVLVETGFVAHRVNERLSVRVDDGAAERLTLTSGGVVVGGRGGGAAGAWDPAPGTLGARLAGLLRGDQALWAGDPPPALALRDSAADAAADWGRTFTIAWPAYRRPAAWGRGLGLVVDAAAGTAPALGAAPGTAPGAAGAGGAGLTPAVARGDLSLAAAGDFKRDRGKLLARLVTRAAVRAALVREAGRKHRGLDDVVRFATNVTEQADTRSWHLLPAEVQVVRLRSRPAPTRSPWTSEGGAWRSARCASRRGRCAS
jgi:hypothetical protein